jgi:hypothetical protein
MFGGINPRPSLRKTIRVTLPPGNYVNYVLSTSMVRNYRPGVTVIFTVLAGAVLGSSSTGSYALTVDGSWSSRDKINIVNYGYITGAGGGGGEDTFPNANGSPGGGGGPAIRVFPGANVGLSNFGVIQGGGGGGGAGAMGTTYYVNGSGGGGGAGYGAGAAGGDGWHGTGNAGIYGSPGSLTAGGAGGPARTDRNDGNQPGGNGGGPGSAGAAGGSVAATLCGDPDHYGGAGGGGGAAITGYANIGRFLNAGTILGAIS